MKTLLVLALLLSSCTDESNSRRALLSSGFTDITFTGYGFFSCGEDRFRTNFQAKNVNGQTVTGTVCCGWVKACTVRF